MDGQRVALVGLGSMGGGMAKVLVDRGFRVHGFDADPQREADFTAIGGAPAEPEALAGVSAVVLVVVNAAQVTDVLFADNRFGPGGMVGRLSPEAVVVNCATVSPAFARETAARVGPHRYLDAPVSGGTARAASGELAALASGTSAAFERAGPVLHALSRTVYRLGEEAGAGSAMKAVDPLLAGVHIVAAAEAITFGISQGLDPARILSVIEDCAGNSWMLQNRGPHIRDGDYAPLSAVEIFVKDLGLVEDIAREARFSAPLTAAALAQFLAASGSGLAQDHDAAVARVYARNAGLALPGDER